MKAMDIKSGRFIEIQNGTKVTMKGHCVDWFRESGGYHCADRDYDTPMKEDLALGRGNSWVTGGVSIRSVGPTRYAVWSQIEGVRHASLI